MTISEAIAAANGLLNNSVQDAQKTAWLTGLDAMIYKEILSTHDYVSDAEDASFLAYLASLTADVIDRISGTAPEDTPTGATQLLMDSPYDEAYVHYLLAKIYFSAGEYQRYSNEAGEFTSLYGKYADYINRTYSPKSAQKITLGG